MVGDPGQSLERMAHRCAGRRTLRGFAVPCQDRFRGGEVEAPPVRDPRADDRPGAPASVGDDRRRVEVVVIGVPVVDELEGGRAGRHVTGDGVAAPGRSLRGNVAPDLHGHLELQPEAQIVRRPDGGRTLASRKHRAVCGAVDAAQVLHGLRGERDLVADRRAGAAIGLEQAREAVLNEIGVRQRRRGVDAAQRAKTLPPAVGGEERRRDAVDGVGFHPAGQQKAKRPAGQLARPLRTASA